MEQVRYSSQARMNHIADNISAGEYALLPNCQAINDNMRGIRVQSEGGFIVGVSVAFIDDHAVPSIVGYIKEQIDAWEAFNTLIATEPPTLIHQ